MIHYLLSRSESVCHFFLCSHLWPLFCICCICRMSVMTYNDEHIFLVHRNVHIVCSVGSISKNNRFLFVFVFSAVNIEWWSMYFNITSTGRWSAKWRIAMRKMESNTECAYDFIVCNFIIERAKHIFACQRWCFGNVPQMAWFSRQGQWISKYHQVSGHFETILSFYIEYVFKAAVCIKNSWISIHLSKAVVGLAVG